MINYPNGKKAVSRKQTGSATSRGMDLEKDINSSNEYYRSINRALIYKKPTPIQVVKVDYPQRKAAKIVEAYYKIPSTTDYNGVYRAKYLDFEAKETKSKTAFTFRNIHPHQIDHLKSVMEHGGIAFLIIRFTSLNETYLLPATVICDAFYLNKRQSLTYQTIKSNGYLIKESYAPVLKYLDIVDSLYFEEEA